MRKTTGVSLILLIFLSLCLMTFSLLSLSGAVADEKLSKQAADRTTEYYEAVSAANEVIADIDLLLAEYVLKEDTWLELCTQIPAQISSADHPRFKNEVSCCTSSGSDADTYKTIPDTADADTASVDAFTLSFDISVTEDQLLHVVLALHYPKTDSDVMYNITEWSIVNTQEWNADRTQNLFRTDSD